MKFYMPLVQSYLRHIMYCLHSETQYSFLKSYKYKNIARPQVKQLVKYRTTLKTMKGKLNCTYPSTYGIFFALPDLISLLLNRWQPTWARLFSLVLKTCFWEALWLFSYTIVIFFSPLHLLIKAKVKPNSIENRYH